MSATFHNDPEFNDPTISKPKSRRGFRPIEVLTIVAITMIPVALLLPLCRSAGPAARRAQCVNNLKQIALALHNYVDRYDALPPAHTVDASGQPLHSWRTLILPYLEQDALYRSIDLSKPWNDPENAKALATPVSVFRCPEQAGPPNATTYLAIVSPTSAFRPREPRRLDEITDGHDCTLIVIEASEENAVSWMAPVDADESLVLNLGTRTPPPHTGGANGGFVDGYVRFLKSTIPDRVWRALISISGHDDPPSDEC